MNEGEWPEFRSEFLKQIEALIGVNVEPGTRRSIEELIDDFAYRIDGIKLERDKKIAHVKKNNELSSIKQELDAIKGNYGQEN